MLYADPYGGEAVRTDAPDEPTTTSSTTQEAKPNISSEPIHIIQEESTGGEEMQSCNLKKKKVGWQ